MAISASSLILLSRICGQHGCVINPTFHASSHMLHLEHEGNM